MNEQLHVQSDECRHSCDIHRGERPYSCEVCNRAFSFQSHLIRHKCVHSGERPYVCDVCNKAYREKSKLIRHKRTHTGERPYFCDVCNEAYSDRSNLIRHKRIHTYLVMSASIPLKCVIKH